MFFSKKYELNYSSASFQTQNLYNYNKKKSKKVKKVKCL